MTYADLVIWFACRAQAPTSILAIHAKLGAVDHKLNHLVELGLLNSWHDAAKGYRVYSLKNWASYQPRKAA
jgi:hypothetical protein